jgi:hypothetical protein
VYPVRAKNSACLPSTCATPTMARIMAGGMPEAWCLTSAADRMPIASTLPTGRVASTWRRLRTPQDLDLDFELSD